MKNIILIIIFLFTYSCSTIKKPQEYWNDAKRFRTEKKLMEAITSYKSLISNYPESDLSPDAQFQIADIYLNDTKDFEYAIDEFNKVILNYPEFEVAKKSLFMIGYVYNNYLDAYTDAINNYNLFKNKYPNDELIPSVDYELEGLTKINNSINNLIKENN
jgi:TolA-binding protein